MYMHGRIKKEGGNHLPQKIIFRTTGLGQHMQSVPSPKATRTSVEGKGTSLIVSTATDTATSFSKDGRKISVGDCALFKPAHDSPPFIGVIHSLVPSEDKNLQLGVTWLYRPAEVKLGKSFFLDAAPNEIFYSFHKDENISAASLLHPCKVAFLPKGVELPKGISSFVCRRVYDIDNKCLWWLTDKDYLDERQEEVNNLLNRTQKEMDSIMPAGGYSPTLTSAASHLKSASDNLQNSVTSSPSQIKGKKRERSDQSYDPVKREHQSYDPVKREHQSYDPVKRDHQSKADDGDSGSVRAGNRLRLEIAKISERGGLIDSVSVEKLVELIRPRVDRKLDLATRSMVSGVIAATDRFDCLSQFVQLKGLSVLDEWLQDVHKGRVSDSSGSRDDDKSVEEFLFVLLRALDRLPVNLHALQNCNIGRSVNHLRSHKNMEIQKKARSLVDTWKKRVEAEMNVIDAKSGSPQAAAWPSKSRLPEVHGGRTSGGSCDVAMKSSGTQPAESKAASIKSSGEATTKSACSSPGPIKSASMPASGKEIKARNVPNNATDVPLSTREDKNSNSASHHISVKEDGRFPIAGTMNMNKVPSGGSRHRKSNNGFTETLEPGSLKETVLSRCSSVPENAVHEKFPQYAVKCEKPSGSVADSGSHKLIVKIPNRSRGASQCPIGGSGDPSLMSGQASPGLSYRCESDQGSKNCETYQANVASHVNMESVHGNDHNDLQAGSDVGDRCPAALHDEDLSKNADENRKTSEGSISPFSSLNKDLKVKKLREASTSAMDALIKSCAKYSEESASTSPRDDVGMNLLATVASREVCSSEAVPLVGSLQRNTSAEEEHSLGDGSMSKTCPVDDLRDECPSVAENGKMVMAASCVLSREEMHLSKESSVEHSGDRMAYSDSSEGMKVIADCSSVMDEKSSNAFSCTSEEAKRAQDAGKKPLDEKQSCLTAQVRHFPDTIADGNGFSFAEVKTSKIVTGEDYSKKVERSSSSASGEIDSKRGVDKELNSMVELKPALIADCEILQSIVSCKDVSDTLDEIDAEQADKNCLDRKVVVESSQGSEGDEKWKTSKLSVDEADKLEKKDSGAVTVDETPSAVGPPEVDAKLDFDLNEVLSGDDGKYDDPPNLGISGCSGILHTNPLLTPLSVGFTSYPGSITVAAAAKGNFVPPVDPVRVKGDLGWKGSAVTSAFRPTEPRKVAHCATNVSSPDESTSKLCQRPLDIDLNVADEICLEDMTSQHRVADLPATSDHLKFQINSRNEFVGSSTSPSGGLDLDLNRVDDSNFMMQYPASSNHILAAPPVPFKSFFPSSLPANDVKRDFDLNSGPAFDDGVAEQSLLNQRCGGSTPSMHSLLPFSGLRPNGLETGNLSNCFPHSNPYSSVLQDRGGHPVQFVTPLAPQRILSPSSGSPFMSDMYRGAVLPSSPAVPYPSNSFPYQMFPFGATLPRPSGAFTVGSPSYMGSASAGRLLTTTANSHLGPVSSGVFSVGSPSYMGSASTGRLLTTTANSHFLGPGPVSAVASQYPKPFATGHPDGHGDVGVESSCSSRKWSRTGLDLNAGPGILDVEGREDFMPQRQLLVSSSSHMLAEERERMYSIIGGSLKRKEPEGGLDKENFRYKQQPSWQ